MNTFNLWLILIAIMISNFILGQILYQRKFKRDKVKFESKYNNQMYEESDKYLKRQKRYREIKRNGFAHLVFQTLEGGKI